MIDKEIYEALKAIVDGYPGSIKDGLIIVENPEATEENIALKGVNPNLVVEAKWLLALLDPR